jgi:TonB family protein
MILKALGVEIAALPVVLLLLTGPIQAAQQPAEDDRALWKDVDPVESLLLPEKQYGRFSVLKSVKPEYPPIARKARLQGRVTIRALVDETGRPRKTAIVERDPAFLPIFDEYARKAVMKSRYSPMTDLSGKPVRCQITIPISFRISDYEPALCVNQAIPEYPEEGYEQGLEGWVVTGVIIDEWGKPERDSIRVFDRCPRNATFFDGKAEEATKKSSFKAATYKGRADKGWVFLKVDFRIETGR